jgi:hypothetical protein
MNDACQQKPGTDAGHLTGKGDAVKSPQTPHHPLSSSETSISNDDTMGDMEVRTTKHDDTLKPKDTPAISKRPKKMRYDKFPDPPPEWTRGTSRRAAYKNGKAWVSLTQTALLTTFSDIGTHDGGNKTSNIKHQCH